MFKITLHQRVSKYMTLSLTKTAVLDYLASKSVTIYDIEHYKHWSFRLPYIKECHDILQRSLQKMEFKDYLASKSVTIYDIEHYKKWSLRLPCIKECHEI